MPDARCWMFEAISLNVGDSKQLRDNSSFASMAFFHALQEVVEFLAQRIESGRQIIKCRFVGQGTGFEEWIQMVDRLVRGTQRVHKMFDELLLVTASPIPLDDVRAYRLPGSPNLTALFEHLELRQFREGHLMHCNRRVARQLPDFQVSITHKPA